MAKGIVELHYHNYRYFPYEVEFALREAKSVGKILPAHDLNGIKIKTTLPVKELRSLVYFSKAVNGRGQTDTTQHKLETAHKETNGKTASRRQSTRYSVHGLHEYKGKFNPQTAAFLLRYLRASRDELVIDPFCGSGTLLVEAAHAGLNAIGYDINPLAVEIANTKSAAIEVHTDKLEKLAKGLLQTVTKPRAVIHSQSIRQKYLSAWFRAEEFAQIEAAREFLEAHPSCESRLLRLLVSDLLRTYSLQEPSDLRIRRRNSPFPDRSFYDALRMAAARSVAWSKQFESVRPSKIGRVEAQIGDVRDKTTTSKQKGAVIITSPPYATALPYIDTQRLSLVWLGLCAPDEIGNLDAELVGSREFRQKKAELIRSLDGNQNGIPDELHNLCIKMRSSLSAGDGFRRRAVPLLFYRYLSEMLAAFTNLRSKAQAGARLAMVIGGNHTVLGGKRFDLDTPLYLKMLGEAAGWRFAESIPLQTYHRYGLHSKNATRTESVVIWSND